jgi:hypothetical protein
MNVHSFWREVRELSTGVTVGFAVAITAATPLRQYLLSGRRPEPEDLL